MHNGVHKKMASLKYTIIFRPAGNFINEKSLKKECAFNVHPELLH